MTNTIQVYEHQKLSLGGNFKERHRQALLKLNELHSFNYMEATYKGVKFKDYVGIVQVDGLCIEILPKIDSVKATKNQWRDALVEMLRISGKIKATDANHANVQKRRYNLLEIYLDLFLREVEGLIRQGLCKQYRRNTSNTLALKGKLEIAGHIRENLIHKERFHTTHQVYDLDHKLHKIIRCALDIVCQLSTHSYLSSAANRVSLSFPEIDSSDVSIHSFDNISYTRKTNGYKKTIGLAKIISENYSPSISNGRTSMIALLFNMNSLWEDYIFQSLRKGQNIGVYTVSREIKSLFVSCNYSLKPDMFLEFHRNNDDSSKRLIIDTKWKVPSNQKASMQDLRQIYTYNQFWKSNHGILLYPGIYTDTNWMQYADNNEHFFCKLAFINVLTKEGVLNKELNVINEIDDDGIFS